MIYFAFLNCVLYHAMISLIHGVTKVAYLIKQGVVWGNTISLRVSFMPTNQLSTYTKPVDFLSSNSELMYKLRIITLKNSCCYKLETSLRYPIYVCLYINVYTQFTVTKTKNHQVKKVSCLLVQFLSSLKFLICVFFCRSWKIGHKSRCKDLWFKLSLGKQIMTLQWKCFFVL